MNSSKLSSIKTYLLVGYIFAIFALIAWILIGLVYIFGAIAVIVAATDVNYYGSATVAAGVVSLIIGVVLFLFMLPTILVFRRIGRMRGAANRGDIATLKHNDSVGWGIIGLIFVGVITGIMMLIAHGPIQELTMGPPPMQAQQSTGVDLDRLSKLKGLLDSGVITQGEFDTQKNMLLNPSGTQPKTNAVEGQLTKLKSLYDAGVLSK